MNKRHLISFAAVALCFAAPFAEAGVSVVVRAHGPARAPVSTRVRVVDVDPVFQRVAHRVPVRECSRGHCRTRITVRHEQRVVAYRVTWAHQGQRGVVRMTHRPGGWITVGFNIPRWG
ncbi:MAG: hypothetical protein LBE59_04230 [Nevskiaceae bacterium]|jgi:uncharacterized protein YcfJ|nr:hypothetical protein [Nevskiaceae bacterium]